MVCKISRSPWNGLSKKSSTKLKLLVAEECLDVIFLFIFLSRVEIIDETTFSSSVLSSKTNWLPTRHATRCDVTVDVDVEMEYKGWLILPNRQIFPQTNTPPTSIHEMIYSRNDFVQACHPLNYHKSLCDGLSTKDYHIINMPFIIEFTRSIMTFKCFSPNQWNIL